jgi:hypothetical protein
MQHMPPKPAGLLEFSDPCNHGDGTVSFQLRRQDGESLAVSCPIPDLANIINYFCQLFFLQCMEAIAVQNIHLNGD